MLSCTTIKHSLRGTILDGAIAMRTKATLCNELKKINSPQIQIVTGLMRHTLLSETHQNKSEINRAIMIDTKGSPEN